MGWKKLSHFGMKLYLNKIKGPKQLLALDIGSLCTGVAISCLDMKKAYYLKNIKTQTNSPAFFNSLKIIFKQNPQITGVIIGQPCTDLNNDRINLVIGELSEKLESWRIDNGQNFPYSLIDESWTTKEAKDKLRDIRKDIGYFGHLHNEKDILDGIAATKILERYLSIYNKK